MENWKQINNILCSEDDALEKIASIDNAKLLVISDSHGSEDIITEVLKKFGEQADALCFCGDGADDLLYVISNSWRVELEGKIPKVVAFVQGNGDNSVGTILTNERLLVHIPIQTEFFVARKKILITHGHRYNVYMGTKQLKTAAENSSADMAFFGHTHIANVQTKKPPYLLNPGSCTRPRGGLPPTFAFVEISRTKKFEYNYYEITWNAFGEIDFRQYNPPTEEINILW